MAFSAESHHFIPFQAGDTARFYEIPSHIIRSMSVKNHPCAFPFHCHGSEWESRFSSFTSSRYRVAPGKIASFNLPGLGRKAFTILPPRLQIMTKRFGLKGTFPFLCSRKISRHLLPWKCNRTNGHFKEFEHDPSVHQSILAVNGKSTLSTSQSDPIRLTFKKNLVGPHVTQRKPGPDDLKTLDSGFRRNHRCGRSFRRQGG